MEKSLTLVELRDAIAKAIADAIGHGMREKCERHADAVLAVVGPQLLSAAHTANPPDAADSGWVDEALLKKAANMLDRAAELGGNPGLRNARHECAAELRDALAAQGQGDSFQQRVSTWMAQCFLPSLYSNMTERGDRLLEEVLELLQSKGYDRTRVATLVDYVWSRPVGEPSQEVGGVMVTLAGFCWIAALNMHAAGETELTRIGRPEVMDKIRRKQEAKNALHFDTPLPGNATASPAGVTDARIIDLAERLVASGPKASHVSASECHEISEFILALAAPSATPGGEHHG